MTRREEIVKATKECREDYVGLGRHLTSDDIADAFEEGAEWADKTMIDRACKWMEYNLRLFVMNSHINHSAFEQEFRKVMEE